MPHNVNRNAFLAASRCGHPLICAYGQLVATELALKDHGGAWQKRHDIPQMLDDLGKPGLTALGAELRKHLSSIPCTNVEGNPVMARPKAYPDLRYARYATDYAGGTSDAVIRKIAGIVGDIITQLRNMGISV